MPLSDIVNIQISTDSANPTRKGFGTMLVLSTSAPWGDLVRSYLSTDDMIDDGFEDGGAEVLAAGAAFRQNPRPEKVKVGRLTSGPTLQYTLDPQTIASNTLYKVRVSGPGMVETIVSIDSGGGATNDSIVAALETAINAVASNNYTAAVVAGGGDTDTLTVTADAASDWFSLEVLDLDLLAIRMTHASPGTLAAQLSAINLEDDDWFGLVNPYQSEAMMADVADWVEENEKAYIVASNDSRGPTGADGNGDIFDDIQTAAYARTTGWYHPAPDQFLDAALFGKVLPLDPGSWTLAFKTLAGVDATTLNGTQQGHLRDKYANYYYTVAGLNQTSNGKQTGAGSYLDLVQSSDYLKDRIATAVFRVLANATKVPYTDEGVAQVVGAIRGVLLRNVTTPARPLAILAADPTPVVSAPKVADVDDADKADRLLPDITFSAEFSGAIHKVSPVKGTISV